MEDKIKTIEEFYKTQDIDEQFDEVEYAKLVKGSINFYQPYCINNNISDKKRLYYHYSLYGLNLKQFSYLSDKRMILINSIIGLIIFSKDIDDKSNVIYTLNLCTYIKEFYMYNYQIQRSDVLRMLELLVDRKVFDSFINDSNSIKDII